MLPLVMFGKLEVLPTLGPLTPGLRMPPITLLLMLPTPMELMVPMPVTAMPLLLMAMVTPSTKAGEKYKQSETTPKKFNSRLVFTNIKYSTVQISFSR
jgi:hypothetical protein